jgi:hypothetical protein
VGFVEQSRQRRQSVVHRAGRAAAEGKLGQGGVQATGADPDRGQSVSGVVGFLLGRRGQGRVHLRQAGRVGSSGHAHLGLILSLRLSFIIVKTKFDYV